jgi:SAM-dependent methyltransferase
VNFDPRELEWQRRYEESDTPWDKGYPAPALTTFLPTNQISGRVLVPGCGRGHEVRLLGSQPGVSAVGLDLSPTAIAQARELSAELPPGTDVQFVLGDFFELSPAFKNAFDWIVEHTCFCAIEPHQRPGYVLAAASALRPGGKIFAIFYLDPRDDSPPPFGISKEELSALFDSHFILLEEWMPKESFPGREERELVRILQKR